MKAILLAGVLALTPLPALAALPPRLGTDTRLPVSALAACHNATINWEAGLLQVRDDVIAAMGLYPDKAAVYVTQIYQLESVGDLPHLLDSAHLPHLADRLRLTLRQMSKYRDTSCRQF